jgi:hypothetical protein
MQLGLCLQLGGYGLPTLSPTLTAAAQLLSAALTKAALQQLPTLFDPFHPLHCNILADVGGVADHRSRLGKPRA